MTDENVIDDGVSLTTTLVEPGDIRIVHGDNSVTINKEGFFVNGVKADSATQEGIDLIYSAFLEIARGFI